MNCDSIVSCYLAAERSLTGLPLFAGVLVGLAFAATPKLFRRIKGTPYRRYRKKLLVALRIQLELVDRNPTRLLLANVGAMVYVLIATSTLFLAICIATLQMPPELSMKGVGWMVAVALLTGTNVLTVEQFRAQAAILVRERPHLMADHLRAQAREELTPNENALLDDLADTWNAKIERAHADRIQEA